MFLIIASATQAAIVQGIDIDFVTIGNLGNAADSTGFGEVNYNYSIGNYEVTNAQWNAFTLAVGAPTGNNVDYGGYNLNPYDDSATHTGTQQPANNISWFESQQFCNFLTSGDKSQGVYQFSGNNANPGDFIGIDRNAAKTAYGTIYFLPTEDEWYKAAYYTGSGYSLYANGGNTIPGADNGWNYSGGDYSTPWDVGTGTEEQNGTFDMMGNVAEWTESLFDVSGRRIVRGGSYGASNVILASSYKQVGSYPFDEYDGAKGFRVASVPEPATVALFGLGGLLLRKRK